MSILSFFISVAHAVTISPVSPVFPVPNAANCSDPSSASCNPAAFISTFYSFALIVAGVLAFGVIVYGGIRYATGKGNPSSESEGKSWITGALLGLLLLAGAYVILYTINPNLVSLRLSTNP